MLEPNSPRIDATLPEPIAQLDRTSAAHSRNGSRSCFQIRIGVSLPLQERQFVTGVCIGSSVRFFEQQPTASCCEVVPASRISPVKRPFTSVGSARRDCRRPLGLLKHSCSTRANQFKIGQQTFQGPLSTMWFPTVARSCHRSPHSSPKRRTENKVQAASVIAQPTRTTISISLDNHSATRIRFAVASSLLNEAGIKLGSSRKPHSKIRLSPTEGYSAIHVVASFALERRGSGTEVPLKRREVRFLRACLINSYTNAHHP